MIKNETHAHYISTLSYHITVCRLLGRVTDLLDTKNNASCSVPAAGGRLKRGASLCICSHPINVAMMQRVVLPDSSSAILGNTLGHIQPCKRLSRSSLHVRYAQTSRNDPSQTAPRQDTSNGNGNGTGISKGLISSNNGVVLDRKGSSLEDRIASGEFSKNKVTKEKVLRPVRRALARDPIGPGVQPTCTACPLHHLRMHITS